MNWIIAIDVWGWEHWYVGLSFVLALVIAGAVYNKRNG